MIRKWIKRTLYIILFIAMGVGVYKAVAYNSYYPDDEEFLKQQSSQIAGRTEKSTQEEMQISLIDVLDKVQIKPTPSRETLDIVRRLYQEKILLSHPYRKNPLAARYTIGQVGKWISEKESVLLPLDSEVSFPLTPKTGSFLEFSLASPTELKKGELMIRVRQNGKSEEIKRIPLKDIPFKRNPGDFKPVSEEFSNISEKNGWKDIQVDLNEYSGKKIQLVFSPSDESGEGVVVLGNPMVYRKKQAKTKRYNVLYIIYDGMAREYMGVYNRGSGLTPFLDSQKDKWIVFERMYSHASKTRTFLSGFFTGVSPLKTRHGISFNSYPDEEKKLFYEMKNLTTIPRALAERKYLTLQIGNSGFSHPALYSAFDYGFHESFEFQDRPNDTTGITYHLMQTLEKNKNKPFFSYVHFNTTHTPRKTPLKYYWQGVWNYPSHSWRPDVLAATRYADRVTEVIYHYLERSGLLENTIVIISADHSTCHDFSKFHSNYNYEDFVRIPFLIHIPDELKKKWSADKKRIETATTVQNFGATLLDMLELPKEDRFSGESFKPVLRKDYSKEYTDELIWSYDSFGSSVVYRGRWKYILQLVGGRYNFKKKENIFWGDSVEDPTEHIYDLKNDPEERENLIEERPDLLKFFRKTYMESQKIPEMTLLSFFPDQRPREITVRIKTSGKMLKIRFLEPEKEDQIIRNGNTYTVRFKINSKIRRFIFETNPVRVPLEISFIKEGKRLLKNQIYTGPYSLNWYSNPLKLDKKEDFIPLLIHRKPEASPASKNFAVHVGRIDLRWWMHNESKSDSQIETNMKEVLKAWGYIQ
jgi:arylsulfatase A-like enzyme